MTDTTTTATVETITAEVRTLVVGSRQITASVYAQLDQVDAAQILPFGRVTPKGAEGAYLYVVGKHRETGELVRAETPSTPAGIQAKVKHASLTGRHAKAVEYHEEQATRALKQAADKDKEAEDVIDGDWTSVRTYDATVAAAEAHAEQATTVLDRLKSLKEAAAARYSAEVSRNKARQLQDEAAKLRATAQEHQDAADEYRKLVKESAEKDACEVRQLFVLSCEWAKLPLIVLAGLR